MGFFKKHFNKLIDFIINKKILFIQISFGILTLIAIVRIVLLSNFLKKIQKFDKDYYHNSKTIIYDRNGELLTTIKNKNYVIININYYKQIDLDYQKKIFNLFSNFNSNLKKISFQEWNDKLINSKSKFIELQLKLKNHFYSVQKEIIAINEHHNKKILTINKKLDRHLSYPFSLAYLIGLRPQDGINFSSVSKFLNNHPKNISKIQLTIDIRVQETIYKVLKEYLFLYQPQSIWCCVLDLKTREILGWVSLPSFDPNSEKIFIDFSNTDRLLNYTYEMGSICKILSYLFYTSEYSGLNYTNETMINIPQEFKIGKFSIKDFNKIAARETMGNCFVLSSNKAFGSIMSTVNKDAYLKYLNILGLKDTINIDNIFQEKPKNIKLQPYQTITLSYGYGLQFSPIRFLYLLSNGVTGKKKPIHLIKNMKNSFNKSIFHPHIYLKKILQKKTLNNFYQTLDVLGKRYEPLYKLHSASKTGTAKVLKNGQYLSNRVNCTLVTFYPVKKPRYIIFLCVEDPSKGPKSVSHFYTRPPAVKILSIIKDYLDENIDHNKKDNE